MVLVHVEHILQDAVEEVVGDGHDRVAQAACFDALPAVAQRHRLVLFRVEAREVEASVRHQRRQLRVFSHAAMFWSARSVMTCTNRTPSRSG